MDIENDKTVASVSPVRLWFGLAGPALAWLGLGVTDLLIVWFECAYEEEYMTTEPHQYARAACFVLALVLLLGAAAAGATSYRSWRRVSRAPRFSDTAAADVREFIAFLGVVVSVTPGSGHYLAVNSTARYSVLREDEMRLPVSAAAFFSCLLLAGCTGGEVVRAYGPQANGNARRGRTIIEAYGCGGCHIIPGVPRANGLVGPPLILFGARTMIAGELPNTPENLERWLENPRAVEPGTAMPDLGLTADQAGDIVAYLYTLR